jgi:hypothetical protein
MKKLHFFKVEGVNFVLKKWIIQMVAHDGLFIHLKFKNNLGINEQHLFSHQIG